MEREEQLFTISEVSKRLNIPKHTLRFWEKEFTGLFAPQRTRGGQRRFTNEHIAIIEEIKRKREKGVSLSEIKKKILFYNKGGHPGSNKVDLLALRVAEAVKFEVYRFFDGGTSEGSSFK